MRWLDSRLGDEYLQVRRDLGVIDLLKKMGSDKVAIEEILDIYLGEESKQAYLSLDGDNDKERGDSAEAKAEHTAAHWARLIDYEIDKHTIGQKGTIGRTVNRLTVHLGRLFSFVYRAQLAAKAARSNEEDRKEFMLEVWGSLSRHSQDLASPTSIRPLSSRPPSASTLASRSRSCAAREASPSSSAIDCADARESILIFKFGRAGRMRSILGSFCLSARR